MTSQISFTNLDIYKNTASSKVANNNMSNVGKYVK